MEPLASPPLPSHVRGGGMRNLDLPITGSGFFPSMQQSPPFATPLEGGLQGAVSHGIGVAGVSEGMLEFMSTEMSYNAMYMHDHHHNIKRTRQSQSAGDSEDEVARRMWLSADSPTAQPLTMFSSDTDPAVSYDSNAFSSAAYASSQGPVPRMPNIQESSEGEEELNNRSGGVASSKNETDYLLPAPPK